MSNAARVTSLAFGVCLIPGHGPTMGMIITGSGDDSSQGLSSSRVTDLVLSFCGDIGIIVTGSSTVSINNLERARVGSIFTGVYSGTIITGVGTIEVGG